MRLFNKNSWVVVITLVLLAASCSSLDHKKHIIGIWTLTSINVNGMEIGDGKGFIKFWQDGRTGVRSGPGLYEFGKFEIYPEKDELVLKNDSSELRYVYRMSEDSLIMTRNAPNRITVFRMIKSEKLPMDPTTEGVLPDIFK